MKKNLSLKAIKFQLLITAILFTNFQVVYSQTYCSASGGGEEYIKNVKIGAIDNTSSYDASGYHDYTSLSTDVNKGAYYNIEITNGEHSIGDKIGCWIDWNQDNDFYDDGETISISYSSGLGTSTISIPASAVIGNTRMRVRVVYSSLSPCDPTYYGEVEDYTLSITDNSEPEIQVKKSSTNIDISDTLSIINYISLGSYEDITFTICNLGNTDLTIGTVSEDSDHYSIIQQASSTLSPNNTTDFVLRFQPISDGTKITTIQFNNNDADENPFSFVVKRKAGEPPVVDWTYMLYLYEDGTDLDGSADINEWEVNGSIEDHVNYILLYDAQNDAKDGIYYVQKDQEGDNATIVSQIVSTELGTDPNMNDWHTLRDFMMWTKNNYPAQHYGLAVWDHGSGIFKSQITKDITKGCVGSMKLWEMDNALDEFTFLIGRKIDIVGFDVCLLGQIETVYQLKDYADYVIASEKTEPGDGWDYENGFSELTLNSNLSASQLATNIVDAYISSYSSDVTQAATSTAALESDLIPALNAFSNQLIFYLFAYKTQIKNARDNAWNSTYNATHKDLGDFALNIKNTASLPQNLKDAAQGVLDAISIAVIAEGHIGNAGATGLRVWMTEYFNNEGASKSLYMDSLIFSETNWDEYLANYQNPQPNNPVGGTAHTNSGSICQGSITSITLSDYNGNIQWQQSNSYNGTYVNVTGGSGANLGIYTTPELIDTIFYRAALSQIGYETVYSTIDTVNVLLAPLGGTATATTDLFCSNGSTLISLTDYSGNIQWQSSLELNGAYIDVTEGSGENTNEYTTTDLSSTKYFRALLTNPDNGCQNYSNIATVTINQPPVGGTAFTNDSLICNGSTSLISLAAYSGNIQWQQLSPTTEDVFIDIIDGNGFNSDEYITAPLNNEMSYRALLTQDACQNAYSNIVKVKVLPLAEVGVASAIQNEICSGETTQLILSDYTGTIQWQQALNIDDDYLNIQSAVNDTFVTNQLTDTIFYRAIVSVEDCYKDTSNIVAINVKPIPIVNLGDDIFVCEGVALTIDAGVADSYLWSDYSTQQTMKILTAGNYAVTVTTNGCSNSDDINVSYNPKPIANFDYLINKQSVSFTDNSSDASSYLWIFGDGKNSTESDPIHAYSTNENFKVVQIVTNLCGQDSMGKAITIVEIDNIVPNNIANIYPNPNNGKFELKINSNQYGKICIQAFDISGKEVYKKNIIKNTKELIENIDLSSFKSSVYQLRIVSQNNLIIKKIIIE
ncbi:MAG: T9SS type A sorting domain-containing protein [Bacteroidetes bacterium]|nr:T9SS type A sorting domain-containing protein [Bacteroidota bacterium]